MFKPTTFLAPGKINLTLRVIGRLANGYHELDTWMHKVSLFDEISISPSAKAGIDLSCPNSDLPTDESNLVYKAALRFFALVDQPPAIEIVLKKSIPVSAGLGGGSSDCATILTGLNELFNSPLMEEELLYEGKKLGADVPFFIKKYFSARAQGIGEILSRHSPLPNCYIVLVNPLIAVSTGWVFAKLQGKIPELKHYCLDCQKTLKNDNYALTRDPKTYILGRASAEGGLPHLFNDLEKITMDQYPEIGLIKDVFFKYDAINSLMSGSGSTVFGIFTDKSDAQMCEKSFQTLYPDWKVFLTQPLIA